ncbi:dicarboxylate/amino acid:cation symporter [Adlercreutzia equolifaciens]|uniref:dicarboxylate/amino acid:cation symporter n=1 Tax=Adlercreutzia equolifaciens TaxID=446660 RepID=UPI0023AFC0CF|nr:dicarboxylate/amino acid:cation symporter [Adlercreutzia equolifaciens]MDE8702087.1 dicarboxylate/amino acid:cation symporter [Adlercreutzia equolifaciens]
MMMQRDGKNEAPGAKGPGAHASVPAEGAADRTGAAAAASVASSAERPSAGAVVKHVVTSLPFILLVAVGAGLVLGWLAPESVMSVVATIGDVLRQIIVFCVPLIIIGFIAPSIARLGSNVSRILGVAVLLAYVSTLGAALLSMAAGYGIIPHLALAESVEPLREIPDLNFPLEIPAIMSVTSALALALMIGLAAVWAKADRFTELLMEFQRMVLTIVVKIVIPLLPFFIVCTFATLSYEGVVTSQLPVFIVVIAIVLVGHFIWLGVLYGAAGAYSRTNPWEVLKHYGSAYLTAVGTMSSAATLGVALECAGQAKTLRRDMVSFGVPLFANIHLCGSVLTEVFFCMVVSQILYGGLPSLPTMLVFCVLLGVFAIGAPGVPGGTVMASLGLVTGLLGFDGAGTALVLTVFALQDSFGTACNITGDGALTLMLSGYANKHHMPDQSDVTFFDGEIAEGAGVGRGKPADEGATSEAGAEALEDQARGAAMGRH